MNQYLQKCSANITSGVHVMAANKKLTSDLSSPNSVYNGMTIGNSISHTTETTNILQQLPSCNYACKIGTQS